MLTSRRGLLGMFAAGVGAAVLPSGIIMPVKTLSGPKSRRWELIPESLESGYNFGTDFRIYRVYDSGENEVLCALHREAAIHQEIGRNIQRAADFKPVYPTWKKPDGTDWRLV